MIGLLSAVFNISVCVGFPITVFIVLLAKSKKGTKNIYCRYMHILSCTNTLSPTSSCNTAKH